MRAESSKYDDKVEEHPIILLHSNTQEVKYQKI